MYPDHTAPSNLGLLNFLFYFFKQFIYSDTSQQLYVVPIFNVTMVCQSFKGRELPLHDNTPGKLNLYFIIVPATVLSH